MTAGEDGDVAVGEQVVHEEADDTGQAGEQPSGPRRPHRLRRWLIGAGVAVVVIVVAGLLALKSLVGPAPAPLTLPPAADAGGATDGLSGTWGVDDGSTVGYRVDQIIVGTRSPIAARTDRVTGSVTITGPEVTAASFRVELDGLATNASQREALGVAAHPRAELTLTEPIDIGGPPAAGGPKDYPATGDLSFHGVTRPVDFTVSAQWTPEAIDVLAEIPLAYGDWGITIAGMGDLGSLDPTAILEVLLHLTR